MNKMQRWLRLLALGCGLGLATGVAQAVPFMNGSFESASVTPGSGFITLSAGNTSITGWTVTSGTVEYIGTFWQASDGIRSVDLNGNSVGSLSQAFDTIIGTQYEVQFDLAGNPGGGPTIKTLLVSAANDSTILTFDVTGQSFANMGYQAQSFFFTAVAPIATLAFTSLTSGVFGPVVDNVSVTTVSTPVPEPASLLLLCSGLLRLAAWRVRRKG